MTNKEEIARIKSQMLTQNKRGTSWVYFVVVEDVETYCNEDVLEGWRRKDEFDRDFLCEHCKKMYEDNDELPDECPADDWDCEHETCYPYRIEKDVPNLYGGIWFTAEACNAHIAANRHHYNKTAQSYGMSAYHSWEMKEVMKHLVGEENAKLLQ